MGVSQPAHTRWSPQNLSWNLLGDLGRRGPIYLPAFVTIGAVVALLAVIAMVAFQHRVGATGKETSFTLDNFVEVYTNSFVYESLLNTVGFALITVVVALVLAIPIAWLSERTDLPGRSLVFPVMTMTIIIPSFFTAMGWQFLFGNRVGFVNRWIQQITPLEVSPLNINTVVGMGWVEGLGLTALAYIMVAGVFRAMDPSLEESAQVHGISLFRRLWTVTLPLTWPGILGAGLYCVTIAFAAFDVPAVLGLTSNVYTFSTFIFTEINDPSGKVPNYGLVGSSSAIMLVAALFMSWWYLSVISKSNRYAVVTGKGYRPSLISLGRWWIAGWGFILVYTTLNLVLPFITLVWVSLTPFIQMPSISALEAVSLDNFREIPVKGVMRAAGNSAILGIATPTLTTIVALTISWIVVRSRPRFAPAMDVLAFLPHVVPNLIFAVGALLLALLFLPKWTGIYGSVNIILLVYVVTRISFATRIYNSSLLQIHRDLEDAGYVFGLDSVRVLWHIFTPLIRPVLVYIWLWMGLITLRELTVAVFLASPRNATIPAYIWSVWATSDYNGSAAMSLVFVLGLIPLILLYFLVTRRFITSPG